jgi:protoheme IX farnesyltransferase
LTFTVVFSSILGYLLGVEGEINWLLVSALGLGGFLVVASSNGINQIIEKDFDKLMTRTENRPIAQNRMTILEAGIFCAITGIVGVSILGLYLNTYSALLGFASLMSYAFIYTPLKKVSSLAVLVGAFPGAIPPLLGWVAATGEFTSAALVLFLLQFFWQFPHFWSIAWILNDDYKKAGYQLLPSNTGRTKESAIQVIIYSAALIPLSFLPHVFGISGETSMLCVAAGSILLTILSFKLYKSLSIKDAKRLMFISILYNPLVLISLLIDKL